MEEAKFNKNISKFKKIELRKYKSLIVKFSTAYPNIFKKESRTFRISENIAFLVWLISKGNKKLSSDRLFLSSILLSAQDDFMDDARVSTQKRGLYIRMANRVLSGSWNKQMKNNIKNKTAAELLDLWRILYKSIKKSCNDPLVFKYWSRVSKDLNNAMVKEIKFIDKKTSFKSYLSIAAKSIGASFILVSHLASNGITYRALRGLKKSFGYLNNAVRIINDIKTHNQDPKIDAVTILKKKSPDLKILKNMVSCNLKKIEKELVNTKTKKGKELKKIILTTASSMIAFYNIVFDCPFQTFFTCGLERARTSDLTDVNRTL